MEDILRNYFIAARDRHALNVRVMMDSKTSIPEHTGWAEAVEEELGKVAHYRDLLEALDTV